RTDSHPGIHYFPTRRSSDLRATPTRIANAAIPARLRRNGPGNGFAKRCAPGERATALRRPPTTGRAPTHAGAAPKRSNDYKPERSEEHTTELQSLRHLVCRL